MTKLMLIDAAHAEEVRVCVLENGRVEDFDFEIAARRSLRGNIYLARVTRVEPSLQAAFVEFGGSRHGFLAFNEIHPDYYQIPVSDRRLLQEAESEEAALAAELQFDQREDDAVSDEIDLDSELAVGATSRVDDQEAPDFRDQDSGPEVGADAAPIAATEGEPAGGVETAERQSSAPDSAAAAPAAGSAAGLGLPDELSAAIEAGAPESSADLPAALSPSAEERAARRVELLDRYREARRKRARLLRNYKIQEVIKRRQILLVQVVKEERGTKGAALTTYLSLAGRYCVLMPNTARGGGISRKIPMAADRKRLRRVVDGLDVPKGMGLIIRTAGAKRTKAEIKRDCDYLIRLWENIRTLTLKSIAPCLIYEEASLIKRAIRDIYDKDIDRIIVQGDEGYREAKDFMKMLTPSHAKHVQAYKEKTPLFLGYGVESQLDAMYQPVVRLKSGGYIVIHQTEALVAVDVNSGKATRERNIELTALRTNLEAAKEAARQCRLRDLAGLIVVDFIDMEDARNNRAVEKRFREALKSDRARIQIGRISNFGLLEMSRQRRRSGIVDGTTRACPTCLGVGTIRSNETAALRILRAIETEAISSRATSMAVKASTDVALYILNQKRDWLKRLEDDYGLSVEILADASKVGDQYETEKRGPVRETPEAPVVRVDDVETHEEPASEAREAEEESVAAAAAESALDSSEALERGRRRRRRRRRHREDAAAATPGSDSAVEPDMDVEITGDAEPIIARPREFEAPHDGDAARRRRRRGRRGGRRSRRPEDAQSVAPAPPGPSADQPPYPVERLQTPEEPEAEDAAPHQPSTEAVAGPQARLEPAAREAEAEAPQKAAEVADEMNEGQRTPKRARKGWWQRAIGG